MSVTQTQAVLDSAIPKEAADRHCLMVLAFQAFDDRGYYWITQARLAGYCAVSVRAIRNTVNRLVEKGHLEVCCTRNGKYPGHGYRVVLPSLVPAVRRSSEGPEPEADTRSDPEADIRSDPEGENGSQEVHRRPPRKCAADKPPTHSDKKPTKPPGGLYDSHKAMSGGALTALRRLQMRGEDDPELAAKVRRLVDQYGVERVTEALDGLERQYKQGRISVGLLISAVRDCYTFPSQTAASPQGPSTSLARPVAGTSRTPEEAQRLIRAGVTGSEDWEHREDRLLYYVPRDPDKWRLDG